MYYLSNYQRKGEGPKELIDGNLAASGSKLQNIVELVNKEQNYKEQ